MPKVSVLVPVYKVEAYIERCARSLFEQTLDDMEFIFVDDASPDNAIPILQEIISHYPNRKSQVHIVHHDTNLGLTAARNSALRIATGDFIAWCDSDDYVAPDMYKSLYEKALREKVEVVFCDFFMSYSSHEEYHKTLEKNEDRVTFIKQYLVQSWTVLWNMIISRSLLLVHDLQFPKGVTYCENFYLTVRVLFYANKIEKVNDAFYHYNRANMSSIMHHLSEKEADDERKVYLDTIRFFLENNMLIHFQKEMSWRILKNKQDLVLKPKRHNDFWVIYPESHQYIMSCPDSFCNKKIKLFMWMLTHHLRGTLLVVLYLREVLGR